jgi:hypothetical protein
VKFNVAWDSIEKENRNLKILVVLLLLVSICLSVAVIGAAAQAPLVVERSCKSRVLAPVSETPSDDELKAFGYVAVPARFNTKPENQDLLSLSQQGYRATEQDELEKQKMKQVVIVNDVTLDKEGLVIDADRLISVGEIRSTFKFPLRIKLVRTHRSEGNPYGLWLSEVEQIKPEVKK